MKIIYLKDAKDVSTIDAEMEAIRKECLRMDHFSGYTLKFCLLKENDEDTLLLFSSSAEHVEVALEFMRHKSLGDDSYLSAGNIVEGKVKFYSSSCFQRFGRYAPLNPDATEQEIQKTLIEGRFF